MACKKSLLLSLIILSMLIACIPRADSLQKSSENYIKIGLHTLQKQNNPLTFSLNSTHFLCNVNDLKSPLATCDTAATYTIEGDSSGEIILKATSANALPTTAFNIKDTVIMATPQTVLTINQKAYRGGFMLGLTPEGNLMPINILPLEVYLQGVVPKEMPASWPLEALKAQAVAARTYAIKQKGRHASAGYDLCDTAHCQVYGGLSVHHENSDLAVKETAGEIMVYDSMPISAFYHANSGGYVENSEDIYYEKLPYIRAKEDLYSIFDGIDRWSIALSATDLTQKLKSAGYQVGHVKDIYPETVLPSGRIIKMNVLGDDGVAVLNKEVIRSVIGYANIKSLFFEIERDSALGVLTEHKLESCSPNALSVIDSNGQTYALSNNLAPYIKNSSTEIVTLSTSSENFTFNGKGWGHGLGMSQDGAKVMAQQGFDYKEILDFYYTGIEIVKSED